MTAKPHVFPPIVFLVSLHDQPDARAWAAFHPWLARWRGDHAETVQIEGDLVLITLARGVHDARLTRVDAALGRLRSEAGLVFTKGVDASGQRPAEEADFVQLIGEGAPPGFVVNGLRVSARPLPCPSCGLAPPQNRSPIAGHLIVAERTLTEAYDGVGILNLPGWTTLVSVEVLDILRRYSTDGYSVQAVLVDETDRPSARFVHLRADRVLTTPCPEHTPTEGEGFCHTCGRARGAVLGLPHIPARELAGTAVFSRDRFGNAELYFARELVAELRRAGVRGLVALSGLDGCPHAAAEPLAPCLHPRTAAPSPPTFARVAVPQFLAALQQPAVLHCRTRGRGGQPRAFDVAHLLAPGCTPAAWAAAVSRFPGAAALKALYAAADGLLLFCPSGQRPTVFPSHDAMRAAQGGLDDPSLLRLECTADWPALHRELVEDIAAGLLPADLDGIPFATLTGSADRLLLTDHGIFYVSPLYNRGHGERIAHTLEELLGLVLGDPAFLLMQTASVATLLDPHGQQYYPERLELPALGA